MPIFYPPSAPPTIPPAPTVAGRQTLWIPAGAFLPTKVNGSGALSSIAFASDRGDLVGLLFANGTDQYAQCDVAMPKAWNRSTMTAQFHWTVNGTPTGNVTWGIRGVAIGDNDLLDSGLSSVVTVSDGFLGDKREHITAETGVITIAGSPQINDRSILQVIRRGSVDSLNSSAYLLGIKLFYTTTAATDD